MEGMSKVSFIGLGNMGRPMGGPSSGSGICRELWAVAQAVLEAESDHTDVVRWFEEMAKTELR
jgi:3-hydroxyisobutyrate dehydrogenase-like beta-hydroxyacid dehydrogenase